jgi:hypothetical protein
MLDPNLLEAVQGEFVAGEKFFDERTDQSETKARIIQKYFYAWAKVITPTAKQMRCLERNVQTVYAKARKEKHPISARHLFWKDYRRLSKRWAEHSCFRSASSAVHALLTV